MEIGEKTARIMLVKLTIGHNGSIAFLSKTGFKRDSVSDVSSSRSSISKGNEISKLVPPKKYVKKEDN